ncbi:MAG: hypothetical protein FWH04_02745 [Oscillospiraceae bacterium]|nr:hypothetical protein [Oscillospiraceae bacterium]
MMNNKVSDSLSKIKTDEPSHERILSNILETVHSGRTPKRVVHRPVRKAILIAAAIAVMTTAVWAVATGFGGLWFGVEIGTEFFTQTDKMPAYPLSTELREYINTTEAEVDEIDGWAWDTYNRSFDSWNEASDFFGVPISLSTLPLKGAVEGRLSDFGKSYYNEGERYDESERYVYVTLDATLEKDVNCLVNFHISNKKGFENGMVMLEDGQTGEPTYYTSKANGIKAVIWVRTEDHDDAGYVYAQFIRDNALYTISYDASLADYGDNVAQGLKDIIDTFQ